MKAKFDNQETFLLEVNEMKANESGLDRVVRIVLGIVLFVLYFTGILSGTSGIISLIVGAILFITGAVGFCPLYALLKIRTNKS
jgi:hypothetical protein